jgi:hypothetical protein
MTASTQPSDSQGQHHSQYSAIKKPDKDSITAIRQLANDSISVNTQQLGSQGQHNSQNTAVRQP